VKRRPTVGTLLAGRFRIVRFLGHGGHAMVFVAQHVVTHKCYAAKVFEQEAKKSQGSSPSSSQPHARNVSDSVDSKLNSAAYEAANLAEHSHPHMVRLHEYQHCDGWPTMLLELGSLGSLEDVMDALRSRGEYMPESLVATVLAHVILALHELHGANVLHRDVKVANVLISNLLDFKLGDFGVSKHLGQQSETNTFAGTPLSLSLYVLVCIT
jgi:serine/threonine protein kinase